MNRKTTKVKDSSTNKRQCTSTESTLKPILFSMKVVGIYFDPTPGTNKVEDAEHEDNKTPWTFAWIGSRMYCYVVLLMLWFNFLRSAVGIFPVDQGVSIRATLTMWYLQCAINASIIIVSCHKLQHFQLFFKHWDNSFLDGAIGTIDCKNKFSLNYTLILSCIGWVFLLVDDSLIDFVTFQAHFSNLREMSKNFVRPFDDATWSRVMVAVLMFYETGAMVFPVIFVIAVSRMIRTQFLLFKKTLSRRIEEANNSLPSCLAELRYHFLKLSRAVEIINETFKWMLGFSLLLGIFMACFMSYQIISNLEDIITVVVLMFWLLTCFLFVTLLTLSSAGLHEEAQSTLSVLLTAGTNNATPGQIGQLNLFLTKLSAVPVGFTVVDFFLITKEFLLTVGGFYLTYFFLLLQFQIT